MNYKKKVPSNRQYARYQCAIAARVRIMYSSKKMDAEILDISIGGALIRTARELESDLIRLEIPFEGETIKTEIRVVRDIGKDPEKPNACRYGILFRLNRQTKPQIKALLNQVRSRMTSGPDLKCDYWNL